MKQGHVYTEGCSLRCFQQLTSVVIAKWREFLADLISASFLAENPRERRR